MRRRPSRAPARWAPSRSSSAVGPGELEIPAIRGVGGGVIYFIDGKSELAASGRSSSSRSTTTPAAMPG